MRKITSERTKRKFIKELISVYRSDKYESLKEFKKNEQELIENLCRCGFKNMPLLLYKCKVIDSGVKVEWHKMNLPQLKESIILRWVDENYKDARKFTADNSGIWRRLHKHKVTVRGALNCYGFKTKIRELKSKDQSKLEAILVEGFKSFLKGQKYESFEKMIIHNHKVTEKLSSKYSITATQVLVKHGYTSQLNHVYWRNMPIEMLEDAVLGFWNSGYSLEDIKNHYSRLSDELRRHYQTPKDVIIKARVKTKYKWLSIVLDYVVCNYLKKRIAESTKDEVFRAVRSLSRMKIVKNKKLRDILKKRCHEKVSVMSMEIRIYALEVYALLQKTRYTKLEPLSMEE